MPLRFSLLGAAAGAAIALTSPAAAFAGPNNAPNGSATIGTGGSVAAGGTSVPTLGLGAESDTPSGSAASPGTVGSAAAADNRALSQTGVNGGGGNLNGNAMAMGNEGHGAWSKSPTITHMRHSGALSSRTNSTSHEPGSPPVKSTSDVNEQTTKR